MSKESEESAIDAARRRHVMAGVATFMLGGLRPTLAAAQADHWPPPVVKIIVPLGPGGANDVVARMFAQHLQDKYKTAFIVENRVGAGGAIAMEALAKSPRDGSTLGLVSTATNAILPSLRANLRYDVGRDFMPVAGLAEYPLALVTTGNLRAKTISEFVAHAQANPNQLTFGSGGVGTAVHLAGEMLNAAAGVRALHVPFKSTPEYTAALLGGHIDYVVDALINVAEHVRSGKLNALAVTSLHRFPALPNVPTVAESFPGFTTVPWGGLAVPAGTSSTLVDAIGEDAKAFLELPSTRAKLQQLWAEPAYRNGKEFSAFVLNEQEKYRKTIKQAGIEAS